MALDSKKFAFLTGAIAASIAVAGAAATGCNTTSVGDEDDAGAGTGSSGAAGGSSGAGSSSGSSGGGSSSGGDGGGSSSGGDGGACLGDGPAPDCTAVPQGCLAEPADGACEDLSVGLKTGVAASLVECLNTAPTCEGDNGESIPEACAIAAIDGACEDGTAAAACAAIVNETTCGGPVPVGLVDKCARFARALNANGRTALGSCIDEDGCLATEDDSCFDPLNVYSLDELLLPN